MDLALEDGEGELLSPRALSVDKLDDRVCCTCADSVLLRGARGKNSPRVGVRGAVLDEVASEPAGELDRKGMWKLRNEEGACKSLDPRREGVVIGVAGILQKE